MEISKKTYSIIQKAYELKAFCDEEGQLQDDAEKKAGIIKKKAAGLLKNGTAEEEKSVLLFASDYAQTVIDDLSAEAETLSFESLEKAVAEFGYDTKALRREGYVSFCINEAAEIAENNGWKDSAKQIKGLLPKIKNLVVADRKAAEKYIEEYNAAVLNVEARYRADKKNGIRMWGNPNKEIKAYLWEAVTHAISDVKNSDIFAGIFLAAYYNPEEKAAYMEDVFYDTKEFTEDNVDLEFESGSSGKPVLDALALLSCRNPDFLQDAFNALQKDDEKIGFLTLMPKVRVNSSRLAHFLANKKIVPVEIGAETYYVFKGHGVVSEGLYENGLLTETGICQETGWKNVIRMYGEGVELSGWSDVSFMCEHFDGLIDRATCEAQKRHSELLSFFDAADADEDTKAAWLHILYQMYLSKTDDVFGRYKWYAQNAYVYTGNQDSRNTALKRLSAKFLEVKEELDKIMA